MKPVKKSLYELLQVNSDACTEDIQRAHDLLVEQLLAQRSAYSGADLDVRVQTLKVALNTLTSPVSRYAYDAKLAHDRAMDNTRTTGTASTRGRRAYPNAGDTASQAPMALHQPPSPDAGRQSALIWLLSSLKSSVTKSLVFIGLLSVMGMVLQMVFMRMTVTNQPMALQRLAEDKAVIQEYYQTHGVRPASREEVDLLERENQRKSLEAYEERRKQQQTELEQRRFEQETRRRADEVSAALRRSEEEALRKALAQP